MKTLNQAQSLLYRAWVGSPEEAEACWRQWRQQVNLADIDSMSCFLLPLLRPRLEAWLADDHARTLLLGICKQAWSGNQLRFRNLQTLWTAFLRRGIRPVVTGAAASALLTAEQEILPITSFELMVPLDDVAPALEESRLLGWMPVSALPESLEQLWRSLSWVRMSRSGSEEWTLRWRCFSNAPDLASEAEAMPIRPAGATWMGTEFITPAPEWHLAEILAEQPRGRRAGYFCEEYLVARRDRFRPRTWRRSLWGDYRLWSEQRKKKRMSASPLQYLRIRWNARSSTQLPWLAIRAVVLRIRKA